MFFATGNRWNSAFTMPAAANLNYMASRIKFGNAPYATNDFQFHFSGFALTEGGNSPQETVVPGNDILIDGAALRVGGVDYPWSFSGSPSVTIASGALGAWGTVTLPAGLTALADFEVMTFWHVNAGQNVIGAYKIQLHRGEKAWQSDSLANVQALAAADADASSYRNDNNATFTTWRTYIRSFVGRLRSRYPGVRIVWATMPATITTTDRYVTLANQTVAALWGATLQAVNDYIETLMAGTIDAYLDYWAYASNDNTGKWRAAKAIGTLTEQAGTDGTATYTTFKSDVPLVVGQQYAFGATGATVTDVSGSGPYTITRQEVAATVVASGPSSTSKLPRTVSVQTTVTFSILWRAFLPTKNASWQLSYRAVALQGRRDRRDRSHGPATSN